MLRESRAKTTEDKLENVQELLDHAALSTSGRQDETSDRVRLTTLHKGKGLGFPHVFLPAWEVGHLRRHMATWSGNGVWPTWR